MHTHSTEARKDIRFLDLTDKGPQDILLDLTDKGPQDIRLTVEERCVYTVHFETSNQNSGETIENNIL